MSPLVSIGIPVFNGALHIGETLSSVLAQTVDDFEVVVSDNCSTDSTVDIVRSFGDPRIRVVSNDSNIGAIANWNRVRSEARGDFVKLLPADDLLYPACLEKQLAGFEASPRVTLVAGKRDIIDEDGRALVRARGLAGMRGCVDGAEVLRRTVRSGTNIFGEPAFALIRRDVLDDTPPFTEHLPYVVDLRLYCDLMRRGDLYAVDETVGAFRVQLRSESVGLAKAQAIQVRALFRELAASSDGITAADLRVGALRAEGVARMRRTLYAAMRLRRA